MRSYLALNLIRMDERFLEFIWVGWEQLAWEFKRSHDPVFMFDPRVPELTAIESEMRQILTFIYEEFELPDNPFHLEKKKMWRAGDASTLPQYLTDEDYA